MNEVEAKYSVANFTAVRKALRSAGAVYLGTVLQTDRYYDQPGGKLRRSGCGLRLRTLKVLRRGENQIDARPEITFKGPIQPNARMKIRQEIQTKLDSASAADELLRACGFQRVIILQKRRAGYRLGRCRIELDELPLLGRFIEIEGVSGRNVETVRRRLGVTAEHIATPYMKLMIDYCRAHSLDADVVTF
jgi:adenylate cyclase class 2